LLFAACKTRLEEAGFMNVVRVPVEDWATDDTQPADAVLLGWPDSSDTAMTKVPNPPAPSLADIERGLEEHYESPDGTPDRMMHDWQADKTGDQVVGEPGYWTNPNPSTTLVPPDPADGSPAMGVAIVPLVQDAGDQQYFGKKLGVATNPNPKPTPIPAPPSYFDDDVDDCDLPPGGTHQDPNPLELHGYFDVRTGNVTDPLDPMNFQVLPSGSTYLLWGWTAEDAGAAGWGGWGYSHIVAKHGWTTEDERQTRQALLAPNHLVEHRPGRDVYTAPVRSGFFYFHRNSAQLLLCVRRVVVQSSRIESTEKNGDPATIQYQPVEQTQTGLWTSFGLRVARTP